MLNQKQENKISLTIYTVWAVLGILFIVVCLVCGDTVFSRIATYRELEEATSSYQPIESIATYGQYVFLGNLVPCVLFVFSVWGVILLTYIPDIYFAGKMDTWVWMMIKFIRCIIGIAPVVLHIYSQNFNTSIIDHFFAPFFEPFGIGESALFFVTIVAVAPCFLFSFLDEKRPLFALALAGIAIAIFAVVVFVISSALYLMAYSALLGFLVIAGGIALIAIGAMPTVAGVGAIIVFFEE